MIDGVRASRSYPSFELRGEALLEFHRRALGVVALDEQFNGVIVGETCRVFHG